MKLTERYPVTPGSWWCGEFKAADDRSPFPERCLSCRFWLQQAAGDGYCRRYPPQLVQGDA